MSIEDAIEDIQECVLPHIGGNSLRIAIEALEKQIPIPVRVETYPYKQKLYFCPVCNQKQWGTRHNIENGCYCKQCGQKLMWEE